MSITTSIINWPDLETLETRELDDVADEVIDHARNESEKGQGLGSAFVTHCLLAYKNYEQGLIDRRQYFGMVKGAADILFDYYPESTKKNRQRGFLGEVCLVIAFSQMQMDVLLPNPDDDREGKIDLWTSDKEGKILAIQVKTVSSADELRVYTQKNIGGKTEDVAADFDTMVEYCDKRRESLSKDLKGWSGKPKQIEITPMVIVVPSDENRYNPAHVSGIPMRDCFRHGREEMDFSSALWLEIESILYKDEGY